MSPKLDAMFLFLPSFQGRTEMLPSRNVELAEFSSHTLVISTWRNVVSSLGPFSASDGNCCKTRKILEQVFGSEIPANGLSVTLLPRRPSLIGFREKKKRPE